MGWGGRGKKGNGAGSWDYWHGSWQKDKNGAGNPPKTVLAPYDQQKVAAQNQGLVLVQGAEGADHGTTDTSLVKELQASVNAARKAESRVKKIAQEKQLRAAQWRQYEQEVRTAFLSERRRHFQQLAQLDADMERALTAQTEARAKVRLTAQGSLPADTGVEPEASIDVDPWMDCIAGWEEDHTSGDIALQEGLSRALHGPPAGGAPPPGDVHTPPRQVLLPRTPLRPAPSSAAAGAPANAQALGAQALASRVHRDLAVPEPGQAPHSQAASLRGPPLASVPDPVCQDAVSSACSLPVFRSATPGMPPASHGPSLPPGSLAASTRLQPFPPPPVASIRSLGDHYACVSPVLATSDPYVSTETSLRGVASPRFSASPPVTRPKTPKPRTAIKEGSKPTGPLRVRPSPEAHASKVDELRMAASAELGVHFGRSGQAATHPGGIAGHTDLTAHAPIVPGIVADDPDEDGELTAGSDLTTME